MVQTLRDLLIQRAARLQGRPALTAPGWGTLSYAQLRNRAEGVAFGVLSVPLIPAYGSATGSPWDWAAELATAASGLCWDPSASPVPAEVLGGKDFNQEEGRGVYHGREHAVAPETLFMPGLTHGELLLRLRRLNVNLGWDHDTEVDLPPDAWSQPGVRGALWSCLYAGGHARVQTQAAGVPDLAVQAGLWIP